MEETINYKGDYLKVAIADHVFGIVFCVFNDEELDILEKHGQLHNVAFTKAEVDDSDGNRLYVVSKYYGELENCRYEVTNFLKSIGKTGLWSGSTVIGHDNNGLDLIVFLSNSALDNETNTKERVKGENNESN